MAKLSEFLREARQAEWRRHNQTRYKYAEDRGLREPFWDNYNSYVPRSANTSIDLIIDHQLFTREKVRILDIGCGSGKFLIDCRTFWGGKVELDGVTAGSNVFLREKTDFLKINVINGDAQELLKIVEPNSYDFILSIRTFEYLADPWMTLKKMFLALKDGGTGLIGNFALGYTFSDEVFASNKATEYEEKLVGYLKQEYDMILERDNMKFYNILFRKTKHRQLVLPLTYAGISDIWFPYMEVTGVSREDYNVLRYNVKL